MPKFHAVQSLDATWDGTLGACRDQAVSLSLGVRYITNSICPMLHAYLLHGTMFRRGALLRSLVQIVTPSRRKECHNLMKLLRKPSQNVSPRETEPLWREMVWMCYKKPGSQTVTQLKSCAVLILSWTCIWTFIQARGGDLRLVLNPSLKTTSSPL